jgi:hypothetical protein
VHLLFFISAPPEPNETNMTDLAGCRVEPLMLHAEIIDGGLGNHSGAASSFTADMSCFSLLLGPV